MLVKDPNKTTISNGEDSLSLLFQTAVSTNDIDQWFSSFSIHQNHLEGLLRYRLLGPSWKGSDAVGQGRGPRIHIATKFSDDANTGLETIYIGNSAIKSSLPKNFFFLTLWRRLPLFLRDCKSKTKINWSCLQPSSLKATCLRRQRQRKTAEK